MQMQQVESSNIQAIGYDRGRKVLGVQFKNRKAFEYADVPESVFLGMMDAESKGGYFASSVKSFYKAKCIDDGKGGE